MRANEPDPLFFSSPEGFREWLDKNHANQTVMWLGYYKKATGIPSLSWPESVDHALCYGWIDGLRKSVDDKRYKIRFTPRKKNSFWSAVNLKRVPELIDLGLMQPSGLAIYDLRKAENSGIYAYEKAALLMDAKYGVQLKANSKAWAFFEKLAPGYKNLSIHWVMSAKKEETQIRRLNILIDCCAEGVKIPMLRGSGK